MDSLRRKRLLGLVAIGALLSGILVVGASRATAFDDYGLGCGNRTSATIAFTLDSKWNSIIQVGPEAGLTLAQAIEAGRSDWVGDEIRHWKGYWALGSGGSTFMMSWKPGWTMGGGDARTNCPGTAIDFNDDSYEKLRTGTQRARGLGAHEWGHVWGVGHSGRWDSHGGGSPTMSTDWGNLTDQAVISQDDSAAIQFQTNRSGSYGAATANSSFEEQTGSGAPRWWGLQSVSSFAIRYGGQDGSVRYLRFGGPSSSTAVYNTTRLSDISGIYSDNHMYWTLVKGRANYKKWTSASTGHVKVVQKIRARDYPNGNGSWVFGTQIFTNSNLVPAAGAWVQLTKYCYPTTSWDYCTTNSYRVLTSINGTRAEAIDTRIVVYNRMMFGGDYIGVDVDRVRSLVDLP